jgi:YVTN family beta-propeller protein
MAAIGGGRTYALHLYKEAGNMSRMILVIFAALTLWPGPVLSTDPIAYVVNSNGETLSKIDLKTGNVTNDIITLGSDVLCYPNQIMVRDTLAFVVASGTDEIQLINLKTEQTICFIGTGAWSNPYWMDILNDQYLYATLLLENSVAKIDYLTRTKVKTVAVGKSPEGILIAGDKAYIACTGFDWNTYEYDPGRIAVYDVAGDSVLRYIDVGLNPQYLALDGMGRLHVACTGDYSSVFGTAYIINLATDSVEDSLYLGGSPGQITIGPNNVAFVSAAGWYLNHIFTYHALTGQIFHGASNPLTADPNCIGVVAFQDSSCLTGSFSTSYVNIIDSAGDNLARYAVGDGPLHFAFNYIPGDVNGDFELNVLDITHAINWIYKGGPPPRWPIWRANANADKAYNILDILHMISFIYKNGPRPRVGPAWLL